MSGAGCLESPVGPVSKARLLRDLEALGRFGESGAGGGVTRPAFSTPCQEAQDWLLALMADAGMSVRLDGAGNVIGRIGPGTGPVVAVGSHIDTVPGGGKLDGALGVAAGVEAVRTLRAQGARFGRAVEVIAFCDEEGAWLSLLGSRAMAGRLSAADILAARGRDGPPLIAALAEVGLSDATVLAAARPPTDFAAFLELHIEQGPVLETSGRPLGIVDGIAGLLSGEMSFAGRADHAGTTPLALRQDAFRAAAATVTRAFECAERDFGDVVRLTFGTLRLTPGASNVVPANVRVGYDIRALDSDDVYRLRDSVAAIAQQIGDGLGVEVTRRDLSFDAPAPMDAALRARLDRISAQMGLAVRHMPSGAGHDAQAMAGLCPTAMLFVPSRGGVSHHPDESTDADDMVLGVEVLTRAVAELIEV